MLLVSHVIPIAGPLSPQAYDYRVQTIDKYGDNSSPEPPRSS